MGTRKVQHKLIQDTGHARQAQEISHVCREQSLLATELCGPSLSPPSQPPTHCHPSHRATSEAIRRLPLVRLLDPSFLLTLTPGSLGRQGD